jgi:hypothetical protein
MTMPSEAAYRTLVAVLRETSKAIDATKDDTEGRAARLAMGYGAMQSTIMYLLHDPDVMKDKLTRPLALVASAVHDAGRGAQPALLDHAPDSSKPTGTTQETVQISLAWALELLTRTKMGTGRAARWVADEARKAGLTDDAGSTLTPERIIQFRKDISCGRAAATLREGWEALRQHDAALLKTPHSEMKLCRIQREVQVRIIPGLATLFPRSAPRGATRR